MVAIDLFWEGDLMRFNFVCESCEREFISAKMFEISVSEMEDEQLGVVVVHKKICHRCKAKVDRILSKPS